MPAIRDWYKAITVTMQRSRRRISGSRIGKNSRRGWDWPGMFAAMAARLCAPLTESIMKSTAPFTGLVLHNSSHRGARAQRCLLPGEDWEIHGAAFREEIHIRFL